MDKEKYDYISDTYKLRLDKILEEAVMRHAGKREIYQHESPFGEFNDLADIFDNLRDTITQLKSDNHQSINIGMALTLHGMALMISTESETMCNAYAKELELEVESFKKIIPMFNKSKDEEQKN